MDNIIEAGFSAIIKGENLRLIDYVATSAKIANPIV
jgi:hypothetical protein